MKYLHYILGASFFIFATNALADQDHAAVRESLSQARPGISITEIEQSPVEGILQVQISGKEYIYVTVDGKYVFSGRLNEISDESIIDHTEIKMQRVRSEIIKAIDLKESITYKADDEKHEIYVFTDVSCGYCKNFHSHISEFNERGVTVHYLAFPRSGVTSPVGDLMRRVWCAEDIHEALTEAKKSGVVTQNTLPCTSPISKHYQLGIELGITGTPAVYDAQGRHLGGYLTPDQAVHILEN